MVIIPVGRVELFIVKKHWIEEGLDDKAECSVAGEEGDQIRHEDADDGDDDHLKQTNQASSHKVPIRAKFDLQYV